MFARVSKPARFGAAGGHEAANFAEGLRASKGSSAAFYVEAYGSFPRRRTLGSVPITLIDVVACLRTFHDARTHRAATGMSPDRDVSARRVERARTLLAGPLPIAQVASAFGFAPQSQRSEIFRRCVGASAGQCLLRGLP